MRFLTGLLLACGVVPNVHSLFSTTLHGAPAEIVQPGTPGTSTLMLQPWLTDYDSEAVCNDGTPGGYYYKAGSDPSLWLVYLEGGYWCWDATSCNERYQTLKFDMSSSGWGPMFAQSGILGDDINLNPWANANMVFIKYCSSDSWFGDAPASPDTFGFAFRGARIVSATITALKEAHGMGSSGAPERLLFSGCSAGGRGALVNLDAVAAQVPTNVRVQGMLDAAAWVDVEPIIPDMLSLQQMTMDLAGFTSPPIPAECAAQYTGSEGWKCLWPSYRLPFVTTNYFLNAAQFDAFQIMYDTNNLDEDYCCDTPAEQQWVDQFQTQTLGLIAVLPHTVPVYSSVCLVHCLSCNADFWTFMVDGKSLSQSMAEWYFEGDGATQATVVGDCTGWDCTLQCSGGPWEPTNQRCETTTNICANDYYTVPGPPDSNSQSQFAATNYHSPAGGYEEKAATAVVTAAAPTGAPQTGNAVGVVGVTEPALGAQQQSFLACQSQVAALQQQQLAAQNSGDQQAASLAQAQMEQQQAQCQALLQAGR